MATMGWTAASAAPSEVCEVTIGHAPDPPRHPAPARSRHPQQPPVEPIVRIGLNQNAATVTIRSAAGVHRRRAHDAVRDVRVGPRCRSQCEAAPVAAADLQYRITVELDDGATVVMPAGARVRIEPPAAPLEIETRAYRGALEIFGNSRRTLTVVNELPLEDYLRGVVPNELNPAAFGQLEALKAQAVAARTYIQRNLGQYKQGGLRHLRDRRVPGVLRRAHRGSARDAGRHRDARRRRDLRRQADQRALQLHLRRTHRGRRAHLHREGPLPGVDQLRVQASRDAVRDVAIDSRAGRTACSRLRGVKNFSEAARFMGLAGSRRTGVRQCGRRSRRSSARRSIRRC